MNELEKFFNQETSKEYDEVWNSEEIDFNNLEEEPIEEKEKEKEEQKKIVIDGKEYTEEELKELLNKKQEKQSYEIKEPEFQVLNKKLKSLDNSLSKKIVEIFNSLENSFKLELTQNETTIDAFISSVKKGEFEKLLPEVIKIKNNNPFSTWINAYQLAYNNIKPNRAIKNKSDVDEVIDNKKEPKQEVGSKKDDYDEIWSKDLSFNELEQMLIEGV